MAAKDVVVGVFTIRASALNLASKCPGYVRLSQDASHESEAMVLGTRKHEILAKWWMGGALDSEAMANFIASYTDLIDWFCEFDKWTEDNGWPLAENKRVETRAEIRFNESATIVTGHIDAMGDIICGRFSSKIIIDWKTGGGWRLPPVAEDLQMLAYAVAADADVVYRVLTDVQRIDTLELNAEKRAVAKEAIGDIVKMIMADESRRPGPHCENCPARSNCPEFAECSRLIIRDGMHVAIVTKEQAQKGIIALAAAKDLLERVDDALREWVRNNGPIVIDGKEWSQGKPTTVRGSLSYKRAAELLTWEGLRKLEAAGEFKETERAGAFKWRKANK